jgi:hypothetical protein
VIRIGRETSRCLLWRRGITFQRTKTWKESPDPERDAKLDRIELVLERFPDRVFAFDEFGPLGLGPGGRLLLGKALALPCRDDVSDGKSVTQSIGQLPYGQRVGTPSAPISSSKVSSASTWCAASACRRASASGVRPA